MKGFMTRLISGIVLLAIIISMGILGGDALFAFTLLISLIGLWEFYKVFSLEKGILGALGFGATAAYYLAIRFCENADAGAMAVLLIFLILLLAVYVFTFPKHKTEEIMTSFFGMFYVAIMLSFVYRTRMLPDGIWIIWLIFICSWGCDTCAYAVGMLIGKHKMAPVLSPKKSIEGGIGGIVGAALIGYIYGIYCSAYPGVFAVICAVGAAVSQLGDLAASAIKRNHGIKDYGHLIPGHGGIMDRFDSVIITAPIIYVLAAAFLK